MTWYPIRDPRTGAVMAAVATAMLTAAQVPVRDEIGLLNHGLLFLLLTLLVASIWGRYVGLFAAVITNLSLNFFFIPPYYTFVVDASKNVIALFVFFVVSIVGGSLLSAARDAAEQARRRQAETEVALALSRTLSGQNQPEEALRALCHEVVKAFDAPGASVLTNAYGEWSVLAAAGSENAGRLPTTEERAAADRAASERLIQGLGRTGISPSRARIVFPRGRSAAYIREQVSAFVPLKIGDRVLGVLRLDGPIGDSPFRNQPEPLLNAVAAEAALAVQRMELAEAAAHAQALKEADELKSALLNAVSHDLRTPLSTIIASAGSLQQTDVAWTDEERLQFAASIEREAERLNRLVGNLLDLSRIESGIIKPDKAWYDLGALIGEVLGRLRPVTAEHKLDVQIDAALPPVPLDYVEIDEVVTNLVENATKYTPGGTEISVTARRENGAAVVEVADRGPGIPASSLDRIFEPFYRVGGTKAKGTGLGLAVARGLVEAHGGQIWARNREDGGAVFGFRLPLDETDKLESASRNQ